MNAREFKERLHRRAKRAGVSVDADLIAKLEIYYRLLATWNRKINLTALNLADVALAGLVVGYGFAWIGHFVFEKNQPASFKQPLYSLMGDWKMFWQTLTGRIAF